MIYEYGIGHARTFGTDGPHRSKMTKFEADQWMVEWREDCGSDYPFFIIRRPAGDWEKVDSPPAV